MKVIFPILAVLLFTLIEFTGLFITTYDIVNAGQEACGSGGHDECVHWTLIRPQEDVVLKNISWLQIQGQQYMYPNYDIDLLISDLGYSGTSTFPTNYKRFSTGYNTSGLTYETIANTGRYSIYNFSEPYLLHADRWYAFATVVHEKDTFECGTYCESLQEQLLYGSSTIPQIRYYIRYDDAFPDFPNTWTFGSDYGTWFNFNIGSSTREIWWSKPERYSSIISVGTTTVEYCWNTNTARAIEASIFDEHKNKLLNSERTVVSYAHSGCSTFTFYAENGATYRLYAQTNLPNAFSSFGAPALSSDVGYIGVGTNPTYFHGGEIVDDTSPASVWEENDCDDIGITDITKGVKCGLLWAFYPSTESVTYFYSVMDKVVSIYPIGYAKLLFEGFASSTQNASTSVFARTIEADKYFGQADTRGDIVINPTSLLQHSSLWVSLEYWWSFFVWFIFMVVLAWWGLTRKL